MKILVLHTGGTIAMHEDKETGGVSPDEMNPLLQLDLALPPEIELIIEEVANVPSPHMSPAIMLSIKTRIQRGVTEEDIQGVVITHGTDTLEETAYFLDVTIGGLVPIILTGAMRSSNELGSDGFYNYLSALRVACTPEAANRGTLVVMNDEIHSARFVTKTHTSNVATFQSPTFGPVGQITKKHVLFAQTLTDQTRYNITATNGNIPILKAYAGMNASLLEMMTEYPMDGLVVEALGAGNLPPQTVPPLRKIIAKKIPIVLVSRCFNGVTEGLYDYPGGGIQLQAEGIIFCNGLNSQKARLKLLVALNAGLPQQDLRTFMEA